MNLPFEDENCNNCRWEYKSGNSYPCNVCKRCYTDKWQHKTNLTEIKDTGDAEEIAAAIVGYLSTLAGKTDEEKAKALTAWFDL